MSIVSAFSLAHTQHILPFFIILALLHSAIAKGTTVQCDLRLGNCPPLSTYITLISAFTTASQCVYFTHQRIFSAFQSSFPVNPFICLVTYINLYVPN